jgi:hypothetical protein
MAKAECQASAKAEASVNVQCTPPQLNVHYELNASLQGSAKAEFEARLMSLVKLRLPALLEASARAKFVARAGEDLGAAAEGAVKASVSAAAKGDLSAKALFGLSCATAELPKVKGSLEDSVNNLSASLMASADIAGKLKI